MPAPFDAYVDKPARVSGNCPMSLARDRHSVPCEMFGHRVCTRRYPESVVIAADHQFMVLHDWLCNAGETRYDRQHDIPLLQRKPAR